MKAITIDELSGRTDAELRVLSGLCNAALMRHPPLSPGWCSAHQTLETILYVRRLRLHRDAA